MPGIRRASVAALAVALVASAPAEAASLTLREVLSRGRSEAREARAAAARSGAAEQRLRQARGARLPTVSLQEVWLRTDAPAEVFGLQLAQERFALADFAAGDPNDPDPFDNALTRLEVSLPLYTGGELSKRIRQAGLAAEAARERAAWAGEAAALAAAQAYIRLAVVRERIELLERSLAAVEGHVEIARRYLEQGLIVRSELLRAEVERARVTDLLSEARGGERVAEAELSFRLAEPLGAAWETSPLPVPEPLEGEIGEWTAAAEGRRDLVAARRLLEAGELEPAALRAPLKPRVGLVGRWDRNGEAPFTADGESAAVMAAATVDLFAGNRHRAAAAAAELEVEAARAEVELFGEGVALEVRGAWEAARTARERQATAAAAVAAAQETERIVEERFRQGVVKSLDLIDATTARREAEVRELAARGEALAALLRLAVAGGRAPETVLPDDDRSAALEVSER